MKGFESPFEAKIHGKWILAGEHSVVRGYQAIVFPVASRFLSLSFYPQKTGSGLRCEMFGDHGQDMELLVRGTIEKAKEWIDQSEVSVSGVLRLHSNIPVGAGMGASAALCVAIAKWFASAGYLSDSDVFKMARDLEDIYHGKSSGVDIAVCLANQGVLFSRSLNAAEGLPKLDCQWKPLLYLSHTGQRGITKDCVAQVEELFIRDKVKAEMLDLQMQESVDICRQALEQSNETLGFEVLKKAILQAQNCFQEWGLVPAKVQTHISDLYSAGASAVKMTGSGQGGFVLSLWSNTPPAHLKSQLIPCF